MGNSIKQPLQVGQKIMGAGGKKGWIVRIDLSDGMPLVEVASPERGWSRDGSVPSSYRAIDTDTYCWLHPEYVIAIGLNE